MVNWEPSGTVSSLDIPWDNSIILSAWIPVGDFEHHSPIPDISKVPLVDVSEASTFVTPKRAHEHASARYVLASLLSELGFEISEIEVLRDRYRKPILAWKNFASNSSYQNLPEISLSHSGGIAVAAVSVDCGPIGIDAEPFESKRNRNILSMMSSADELRYLNDLWDVDEIVAMQETNRIWVIKESVQKACGFGMNIPPQSFMVHGEEKVTIIHDEQIYRIATHQWTELLDGVLFQFGFSKLLENT